MRIIKFLQIVGSKKMQAKNIKIKKSPNNLLGTERKIAYKGKKYHSGTICEGVNIGFASI
jgi:hypothetical protein